MKKNKTSKSNILFISSLTGAQVYDLPYGLSKSCMNSLVGGLSRRYIKDGIRVNGLAPGITRTKITEDYIDQNDENLATNSAPGRVFLPEEMAEVACFLLSDCSTCISGEVINCDCGDHYSCPIN